MTDLLLNYTLKKTVQIHIYLNLQSLSLLESKAYELGLTSNQYIKHLILKDIESEAENRRKHIQKQLTSKVLVKKGKNQKI